MKNIRGIIKHDVKHVTGSVVAIITIMGLCIVPCLYAWFNIFSNWAPYEADATSRIPVAVANEDKGVYVSGITVNVGEKIVSALEANKSIGWVFTDDSEKALEGVRASDYYAALIIPEDFSRDALSFINGNMENPKLIYYENEKKNAIAPKITGKAKTAVQEQVNSTFIETLTKYISEGASVAEASGIDPQEIFSDIGGRLDLLAEKLDNAQTMLDSAKNLSAAAQSLLIVSDKLTGGARDIVTPAEDALDTVEDGLPEDSHGDAVAAEAVSRITIELIEDLNHVNAAVTSASSGLAEYNNFVSSGLETNRELVNSMAKSAETATANLEKLDLTIMTEIYKEVGRNLEVLYDQLGELRTADETTWEDAEKDCERILTQIGVCKMLLESIDTDNLEKTNKSLAAAMEDVENTIADARRALSDMDADLGVLGSIFTSYADSIDTLDDGLDGTKESLENLKGSVEALSAVMDRLAGRNNVSDAINLLSENSEDLAAYLGSPVNMSTEVIYPVREYGSQMAPFYTVLAQWVGSLLAAVLIKAGIKRREEFPGLKVHQHFFGRYGLYMFVGLAQALIVSLGDLYYVGIQCLHPVRFVLAACMNGITFTMINYALVFALDNIGMAAGVIILVIQVAGAGGTYPIEVLPDVFKIAYPFMPFRYSMDAMKECVAGMYGSTYNDCMKTLGIFILVFIALGLLLYYPALWLNRLIAESKRKAEIML